MRIDAHQHFWEYQPARDTWITDDMSVLRQNYLPQDLHPLLQDREIDSSVVVQADQSDAETDFLIQLATDHHYIAGVVGWVDLCGESLESCLERCLESGVFKGARHILQAEAEGFMLQPNFIQGIKTLGQYQLSYDILTREAQLPDVCQLMQELPEMNLVLDHLSKPAIADGSYDDWAKHMQQLSQYPHLYVKLSGMATEADLQHWKPSDFKPYIDFCLEHFGPSRLMYGSDWPVCLLAGSYASIHNALLDSISSLSQSEQDLIMGQAAANFYRL